MKGDKKTNRAVEFLYELSLKNDDFSLDISLARKQLKIPEKGFSSIEERNKWLNQDNAVESLIVLLNIMNKYSISIDFYGVLQQFLEKNNLDQITINDFAGFIDPTAHKKDVVGNTEDYFKGRGEPFVKIILLKGNTKTDVIDFINDNWGKIELLFLEQGYKKEKRVKKKFYKKRDALIVKLSKIKIEDLRKKLELSTKEKVPKGLYKEGLIVKLLKLKKYGGYIITDGYIRKITQKYRNK